jgi:hypothetical protein
VSLIDFSSVPTFLLAKGLWSNLGVYLRSEALWCLQIIVPSSVTRVLIATRAQRSMKSGNHIYVRCKPALSLSGKIVLTLSEDDESGLDLCEHINK